MSALKPLVSAEWLAANLGDPTIMILDIRSSVDGGGQAAYEAAHIPGAVHTDYAKDGWRAERGGAPGLLPDAEALARLLGGLGIAPTSHVMVAPAGVSPGDFSAAARIYWTIKVAGHDRVSILDGGIAGWRSDPSRPLAAGPPRPRSQKTYPVHVDERARASLETVQRAIAAKSATLVDTRSAAYFEGREKSPQARAPGRLPGALHLDNVATYDSGSQRLRSFEELDRLFAAVPEGPSISYCNTGHQAATNWFVLSEILGRGDATLYDGSMSEWTQQADRPVETGPKAPEG